MLALLNVWPGLRLTDITDPAGSDMLPAIDVQFGAGHVGTRIGAEEVDRLRDLVRGAEPAHRKRLDDFLGAGRQDRRVDLARGDRIDAHAERTEIRRHLTGEGR